MPDGCRPEPGGWNRLVFEVKDLPSRVAELKQKGVHFRNEVVVGPGGKQILVEDPGGNPPALPGQIRPPGRGRPIALSRL